MYLMHTVYCFFLLNAHFLFYFTVDPSKTNPNPPFITSPLKQQMNVFFHNNVSEYKNILCIKENLTSLHDKKVDLPGKAEMSAHAVQTKYKSCSCIQVF